MFNQPEPAFHDVVFARDFPERPFVVRARSIQLRNTGATLSPFNAFQLLQGLETMAVRLDRHEANARAVAAYLAADPRVEWVSFAGFPDHPHHDLVQRYLKGRVPSIITFGAAGGYDAGLAFFDSLQLFKRLLNLGDAKSLAIHPASTTHRQLSDDRAGRRRHPSRDHPPVHRPRAHRRPDRRHRPGLDRRYCLTAGRSPDPDHFRPVRRWAPDGRPGLSR